MKHGGESIIYTGVHHLVLKETCIFNIPVGKTHQKHLILYDVFKIKESVDITVCLVYDELIYLTCLMRISCLPNQSLF
jgi:hypothetical protein